MKWFIACLLCCLSWVAPSFGGEALVKKTVVFETNLGTIEMTLMPDVAPKACENFEGLVNRGYYNGISFHRVTTFKWCSMRWGWLRLMTGILNA